MIENYSNRQFLDSLKAFGKVPVVAPPKNNYAIVIAITLVLGFGAVIVYKYLEEKRRNEILANQ